MLFSRYSRCPLSLPLCIHITMSSVVDDNEGPAVARVLLNEQSDLVIKKLLWIFWGQRQFQGSILQVSFKQSGQFVEFLSIHVGFQPRNKEAINSFILYALGKEIP